MEGSGRGATGSGHKLIAELGGYLTHMDEIWFYVYATPDYLDPTGRRGLVFRGTPGYIWVNQQGRRFHDESRTGGASASPALMRQDPAHAWAILDTPMTAAMGVADPYYQEGGRIRRDKVQELLDHSPYIKKANALDALARAIDVDVPTFLGEVTRYNEAFDAGLERDPSLGKSLAESKRFDTPPYYAIQLFPLARKNFGGVKTDLRCRVLNRFFEPHPRPVRGRRGGGHGGRTHQRQGGARGDDAGPGHLQRPRRRRLGRARGRLRPRIHGPREPARHSRASSRTAQRTAHTVTGRGRRRRRSMGEARCSSCELSGLRRARWYDGLARVSVATRGFVDRPAGSRGRSVHDGRAAVVGRRRSSPPAAHSR